MAETEARATCGGNLILGSVPPEEQERLRADMELVRIEPGQVVCDADAPILRVCFPLTGVFSVVAVAAGDRTIGVATVGREGAIGVPVFLGAATAPIRALCHIDSEALCMPSEAFREEVRRGGVLRNALEPYVQGLFNQIVLTAACNSAHSVEQRCARWLLVTHDRAEIEHLGVTQNLLAQMLGVRRTAVNGAAGALQTAGLIEHRRGRITIRDGARLEAASCGCHRLIRDCFVRPPR